MSLNKVGRFNNFPEGSMNELPETGTTLTFRFLYNFNDPLTGKKTYQNHVSLPATSRIKSKDGKTWIETGLIGGVDSLGNPLPQEIKVHNFYPQRQGGVINIKVGESAESDSLALYLLNSSHVSTNKGRDTSVEPILELVDFKAEAGKSRELRNLKKDALLKAQDMSDKDVQRYALIMGYDMGLSREELRDSLEDMAFNTPEAFLKATSDSHADAKATLQLALQRDLVYVDPKTKSLRWKSNDGEIMPIVDSNNVLMEFGQFIAKDQYGGRTLEHFKKLMDVSESSTQSADDATGTTGTDAGTSTEGATVTGADNSTGKPNPNGRGGGKK